MRTVKALVVKAGKDGGYVEREIEDSLESLQELVGGYIQGLPVYLANEGGSIEKVGHVYINDEGKFAENPELNGIATTILNMSLAPSDWIAGTAVFLGDGPDGEEADVPAELLEWVNRLASRAKRPATTCPRCHHYIPNDLMPGAYPGALSRKDNETEVCSFCGTVEAMEDARMVPPYSGPRYWK